MIEYLLKLAIMIPVICGLAWATIRVAKKLQNGVGGNGQGKSARIIETTMLSPTLKLAVIEFHGREILVSASRHGLTRLAEAPAREVETTEPAIAGQDDVQPAKPSFKSVLENMRGAK